MLHLSLMPEYLETRTKNTSVLTRAGTAAIAAAVLQLLHGADFLMALDMDTGFQRLMDPFSRFCHERCSLKWDVDTLLKRVQRTCIIQTLVSFFYFIIT